MQILVEKIWRFDKVVILATQTDTGAYLGSCKTSMMEFFTKIVNKFKCQIFSQKGCIIDFWQDPQDERLKQLDIFHISTRSQLLPTPLLAQSPITKHFLSYLKTIVIKQKVTSDIIITVL